MSSPPDIFMYQLSKYPHNAISMQVHCTWHCLRMLTSSLSEFSALCQPPEVKNYLYKKPTLHYPWHSSSSTKTASTSEEEGRGASPLDLELPLELYRRPALCASPSPDPNPAQQPDRGINRKRVPHPPNKCIPNPKEHILNPNYQVFPSSHILMKKQKLGPHPFNASLSCPVAGLGNKLKVWNKQITQLVCTNFVLRNASQMQGKNPNYQIPTQGNNRNCSLQLINATQISYDT